MVAKSYSCNRAVVAHPVCVHTAGSEGMDPLALMNEPLINMHVRIGCNSVWVTVQGSPPV